MGGVCVPAAAKLLSATYGEEDELSVHSEEEAEAEI